MYRLYREQGLHYTEGISKFSDCNLARCTVCVYLVKSITVYFLTFCIVTCSTIMPPDNGDSSCSMGTSNIGDTCTVLCDPGYEIQSGNGTRACQDDGSWTGIDVICTLGKCFLVMLVAMLITVAV